MLADAIVDVATELRLADPTEFILLVRGEQEANIADLVNSSSELFFKKGALRYALSADCALGWGSTPSVSLDMEFRHDERDGVLPPDPRRPARGGGVDGSVHRRRRATPGRTRPNVLRRAIAAAKLS